MYGLLLCSVQPFPRQEELTCWHCPAKAYPAAVANHSPVCIGVPSWHTPCKRFRIRMSVAEGFSSLSQAGAYRFHLHTDM